MFPLCWPSAIGWGFVYKIQCASTSSMHFCAAFALRHPLSSAAEAKLWNSFVSWIKELLPCKNTPALFFFPPCTLNTVPAISLTFVLLQLWGQKKSQWGREEEGFVKGLGHTAGLGTLQCGNNSQLTWSFSCAPGPISYYIRHSNAELL